MESAEPFGLEFLEDQTIVHSLSPYAGGTSTCTSLCSKTCPSDGGEDASTDNGNDCSSDVT
jgi:hypothetical protein